MSVVPFVIDGPNPTVVATEAQFRPNGSTMLILKLDAGQLQGNQPNATYDLRIGRAYKDHRDSERCTLREGEEFILLPGGAILIETEEQVWLPQSMLGYIVPKVGLLQDGVSNTFSKVDPGYHDHLVVTLFNLGKKEKTLKQGQKFCALVMHSVGSGVIPYTGPGKKIEGPPGGGQFWRLLDRMDARPGLLAFLSALLGSAIGAVLTYLLTR